MLGWLTKIRSWWQERGVTELRSTMQAPVAPETKTAQLKRILVADGVARTLFEEYQVHRQSERGDEEIGWILLGLRTETEAVALASLPAGTERDAGAAHIRFNSEAQALASRLLRQKDKRLQIVAIVHTHPGNLRWPSEGDLHGDREWVAGLRHAEGVFAIGTADACHSIVIGAHVDLSGDLCFCWYALAAQDTRYRPLPMQQTPGPDLALPLRPVWNTIEAYAEALNNLCRQLAKVDFDILENNVLGVTIGLAESNQRIRVLLGESDVRYYWEKGQELLDIDPHEARLDRAVYLILAELAKSSPARVGESPLSVLSPV
jgi:proteasome lid subunit RPN8/RPN11